MQDLVDDIGGMIDEGINVIGLDVKLPDGNYSDWDDRSFDVEDGKIVDFAV